MVDAGSRCQEGVFCPPATPDDPGCGSVTFDSDVEMVETPGNVLLVFDRSFSMDMTWNGMTRWQAAGSAMVNALMPLADKLTVGAVLFPSPDPAAVRLNCSVFPITSADQVTFKPGAQALTELQTGGTAGLPKYEPIRMPAPGATPTSEGVQMADMALSSATLTGATVVVIITDGEPNCGWNQQQTVDTVARWLSEKQIKTYVVGLPGVAGGAGPAIPGIPGLGGLPGALPVDGPATLNALAVAGGTMTYITPDNPMELEMRLNEVVLSTVKSGFDSCTIALDPAAARPEELDLIVIEPGVGEQAVPHDVGMGGWTVSPDGVTVELQGLLCEDAKSGRFTSLRFEYGCVERPPLPPIEGPS